MILELLEKEYRCYDAVSLRNPREVLSFLLRGLGWVAFLALEGFLFSSLDQQASAHSSYGSFDFLVLFIALSLFVSTISLAQRGREVFFEQGDRLLFALPIDQFEIVFGKSLYLFLRQVAINTLLSLPLIVLYGTEHGLEAPYYVTSLFYGLFLSLALIGPVTCLALVFEAGHRLLQNHEGIQLLLASGVCVGLCFLYRYVLDAFLGLLVNAEVGGIFSPAFLEGLHQATTYLVPAYSLLALSAGVGDALSHLAFLFGAILLSLFFVFALLSHLYAAFIQHPHALALRKKKEPSLRLEPLRLALFKKEAILLFRDSSYTFAYSALLVMEPFLSAIVLKSLQGVLFYNLSGVMTYFPGIAPAVSLGVLLLFSGVISASASASFERERNSLALLKSQPIAPEQILFSKLLVPASCSALAFLLSLITAWSVGLIDAGLFFTALFLGLCLIALENLVGLKDNIDSLRFDNDNGGFGADLWGILLPVIDAFVYGGLSLLHWPSYALDLTLSALAILSLVPSLAHGFAPYTEAFLALEAH